jgi:hypothetical protein
VNIEIDDGDPAGTSFSLHQARRNCCIIEDAKPFAMGCMRVMGATGQIECNAVLECRATGRNGRACGAPRTFHHFGRPGKTDALLFRAGQLAKADAAYVVRMMGQCQHAIANIGRLGKVDARRNACRTLAQQAVFLHRETMAGRQWQDEMVAVEGFQGGQGPKKMEWKECSIGALPDVTGTNTGTGCECECVRDPRRQQAGYAQGAERQLQVPALGRDLSVISGQSAQQKRVG